jgi:hypothetical protein
MQRNLSALIKAFGDILFKQCIHDLQMINTTFSKHRGRCIPIKKQDISGQMYTRVKFWLLLIITQVHTKVNTKKISQIRCQKINTQIIY